MTKAKTMESMDDILRARQFLDGNLTKDTLEWSEKPESKKIIERQRRVMEAGEKERKKLRNSN